LADILGESIGAVADRMVLSQVLIELAQQGPKAPLVNQHALRDSLGKEIEVHRHGGIVASGVR
jgi:hypothetical protein